MELSAKLDIFVQFPDILTSMIRIVHPESTLPGPSPHRFTFPPEPSKFSIVGVELSEKTPIFSRGVELSGVWN